MFNGTLTNHEATQVPTHNTRLKIPKSFHQSKVGSQKPEKHREQRLKGEKAQLFAHDTTKDLWAADKDNLAATRGKPVAPNGIGQRHTGAAHWGGDR